MFDSLNSIFSFITPVSDWLWDFPTNYSWWSSIPVLGGFSFAVLLLMGAGIYFTVKTGFIQVTHFIKGIPATSPEQKTSWKHKAQVVLSIRIDEDTKHDIDILPEDRSVGKLERNASWLSSYTGLDLYVDRPRETRSLYRK